jgi:malate dehydrogenase
VTLGSHGETMVPVPSLCRVRGRPLPQVLDATDIADVVQRTREGGAGILGLLKTGSAFYAPSSAAVKMVRAVLGGRGQVMPVCAWVTGQFGISGVYLGVPDWIGRGGVEEVLEMPFTDAETAELRAAAQSVQRFAEELHSLGAGHAGSR